MRILLINCILSTAERSLIMRRKSNEDCMIYNFARGFVANGHTVTICASEEFKPLGEENNPFEVIYFKSKLPKLFRPDLIPCPKGLRAFVKANINKYDVVIASEVFQLATLLIADICKGKLIIWQELSLHNRMFFKLPSKVWYNIVARYSAIKDALIVPRSESARKFIGKYVKHIVDEIVDHGANGELLKPIDSVTKSFVVVARLVSGKNIESIIRKFSVFIGNAKYNDFVLNVIGDGDERANLESLTRELSIENSVCFLGYLKHCEMARYLAGSYALLVDTLKDLNMVSIPESIISGTPIVMNTVPNSSSFIHENKLGIVSDKWGWSELEEIVLNYAEYHKRCLEVRDRLTNAGCAMRMINIAKKYLSKKMLNESV